MIKKWLLPLVILTMALGACQSKERTATMDAGDFTITCPVTWKAKASEEVIDNVPFMQILLPEKNNHTSNITLVKRLVSGLKAEDFTEAYAQNLVNTAAETLSATLTLDNMEHITLGGRPAVMVRYSGTVSNSKVVFTEQIIPLEKAMYRITYTQWNDSDAEALGAVMNSVYFK